MNVPLCSFASSKMWTLQKFYLAYSMRSVSSTQAGSRFCTSLLVSMKGHGCLEHYRNFHFTRILLHFVNSLRIILAILEDHCGRFTVDFDMACTCTTVLWKDIEKTRWQLFGGKDPELSWWVQSIVYPPMMRFPWLF